jgi:putative membrane protein
LYDRTIDRARSLFFSWAANAIALVVVIAVFAKVTIGSLGDLILAALLFGILNTLLKPVLKAVTLPLAVVTLRLAWFGVAMLMLLLTAAIVDSFDIHGFWALVRRRGHLGRQSGVDIAPGPGRTRGATDAHAPADYAPERRVDEQNVRAVLS